MPRPLSDKIVASTGGEIDAIREHILDAALRVIQDDGLAAASTRAIAAEAGISPGTLYNYFRDRLQLLAQTILRRVHTLSQPIIDLTLKAGSGTISGNLQEFTRHAAKVMDEIVPLVAAAFSDSDLLHALQLEMATSENAFDPGHAIERYLLAERALGRISGETDCRAAASTIVALCHDRAFHQHLSGNAGKTERRSKEIDFIASAIERGETND